MASTISGGAARFRRHGGLSPPERLETALREHVADERVLAALRAVPREHFVPAAHREEAYANQPLPIGHGQTISQPLVVARMCELLELTGTERVLDVGTGSGWHAAILGRLAGAVWSVERHAELAVRARAVLAAVGAGSVQVSVGDGSLGLPAHAPFDAINVAASAAGAVPPALVEQLAPGGRLVAPVGERLVRVRRAADGGLTRTEHERVRFVPLVESA